MEVDSVSNMEEDGRLTQLRFEAAVKVIKSLPPDGPFQPSNDMMLKFYKFYKQATVGPCNIPRPGFWDAVGKAKWDAWNSLGDMSKEKAMTSYVDEMKLILEGMPMTGEVEELLQVLGPFYELVEERKKITQISDLSAARLTQFARQLEGFGTMMNSVQTKSVAKDIVRSMEMNGTLETKPRFASVMRELSDEELQEEAEEDDEDVLQESKKERRSPKKKGSGRRHMANGKISNGGPHLTNGNHSKAALNSDGPQETSEPVLNGHHAVPNHVASDSDSEVYCDSIDQFGQEENSELNRSIDDLEEEESLHHPAGPVQDNVDAQGVQCGGEDGKNTGPRQRPKAGGEMPGSSFVRQGRDPSSLEPRSGPLVPVHSGGDGDGGNWDRAGTPSVNLDEQIVAALARLQEDMQSVLERLHTLEALTASQARSLALSPTLPGSPVNKRNRNPSWWPFDISPTSLAFAIIWPFVVQWLLRVFLHRRRRRIN